MNTEPERQQRTEPLDRAAIIRDLTRLGVPRGGLVMVHSSLRSLGHVAERRRHGDGRFTGGAGT